MLKNYYFFTFGLLSSSILGFYKETIPELAQYYSDFNYYSYPESTFSGLMQDPNYYTIALFVVLFTSLLLYYNNVINILLDNFLIFLRSDF